MPIQSPAPILLLLLLVAAGLAGFMLWSMHSTLSSIESMAYYEAKYQARQVIYSVGVLPLLKEDLEAYNCTPGLLKEYKPDTYTSYMDLLYYGGWNVQNLKSYIEISYKAGGAEPPYQLVSSLNDLSVYMDTVYKHINSAALGNPLSPQPIDCSILPDEATASELAEALNLLLAYDKAEDISDDTIQRIHDAVMKLPSP